MKSLAILAALATSGFAAYLQRTPATRVTQATRRRRQQRHWFDDAPRGYPGAKLARKASEGRLGMATLR